jgi:putative ABC transport system permease protein
MASRRLRLLTLERGRIPFAWSSLVHRKMRLAASIAGVALATTLMFVELGFRNGLFDSQTLVARTFNADLIIVHQHKEAVAPVMPFPRTRLFQARAVSDVTAVYPVYLDEYHAAWKNDVDGREYPILVFGIDPDDPAFLIPDVTRQAPLLKQADTILVDSRARDFYGRPQTGTEGELARRRMRVVGTFPLGPDFRTDGTAIVSDRTFQRAFTPDRNGRDADRVEFGLVRIAAGSDANAVQRALASRLPGDVRVLTKREFIRAVEDFWSASKPVGYVFGTGLVVGFLIGIAICYQTLYTDIVDQLPQYATLKAIGYSNGALVGAVFEKALWLGLLGFVPGALLSAGIYAALQWYSGIRMELTGARIASVMAATLVMCLFGAGIAIRKLIRADPAEVF